MQYTDQLCFWLFQFCIVLAIVLFIELFVEITLVVLALSSTSYVRGGLHDLLKTQITDYKPGNLDTLEQDKVLTLIQKNVSLHRQTLQFTIHNSWSNTQTSDHEPCKSVVMP